MCVKFTFYFYSFYRNLNNSNSSSSSSNSSSSNSGNTCRNRNNRYTGVVDLEEKEKLKTYINKMLQTENNPYKTYYTSTMSPNSIHSLLPPKPASILTLFSTPLVDNHQNSYSYVNTKQNHHNHHIQNSYQPFHNTNSNNNNFTNKFLNTIKSNFLPNNTIITPNTYNNNNNINSSSSNFNCNNNSRIINNNTHIDEIQFDSDNNYHNSIFSPINNNNNNNNNFSTNSSSNNSPTVNRYSDEAELNNQQIHQQIHQQIQNNHTQQLLQQQQQIQQQQNQQQFYFNSSSLELNSASETLNLKNRAAKTPSSCFVSPNISTNNINSEDYSDSEECSSTSSIMEDVHQNALFNLFNYICTLVLLNSNIKSTDKYKAKLCIGFCFTIFSFIPSWIIFFWLSGLNKPTIMAIVALPMSFSSLFILKKTGSTHFPGHILCFTLCFALTINAYYTGGHQSTIRLLMSIVPIISALVIGRKASVQWSLIVLSIFLFFFLANLTGCEYVEGIPTITIRSHMNFIIDVTIVLITMAFTLCYQYFIDEAHKETKLKNAQLTIAKDAAIEAYQARQEFLAMMSHEIRTPLNGLIGMATLLCDSTQLHQEERQMAKAVKSCGDILLRLVNDILDLSKLEANQMGLETIPFRIRDLTHQICQVLSGQAHERGLHLFFEVSNKIPQVLIGDSGRILQVLMNLTGNALKFTQSGFVKIMIDLIESESDKVVSGKPGVYNICFRVKDTGIGVPPSSHQKIFEAFVQADPSDSRKYGGSGLGLYLCAKLVKLMNGEIGVYNNLDCAGSTFWFILPLEMGDENSVNAIPHKVEIKYPPNRIKVLIAEDNIVNQRVAVKFLEKIGITADVAFNGNEVLEILDKKSHYDLIFMDFQMPVLDGLRCSKAIRQMESEGKWSSFNSIFICGLTANTMSTDKKRCFDHGMNHFISKPFQIEQIRLAVDMAIEFKQRYQFPQYY